MKKESSPLRFSAVISREGERDHSMIYFGTFALLSSIFIHVVNFFFCFGEIRTTRSSRRDRL